jgi:hypothetical protein
MSVAAVSPGYTQRAQADAYALSMHTVALPPSGYFWLPKMLADASADGCIVAAARL